MENRNNRRVLSGTVVSNKMDKTITVLVETKKVHPLYKKSVIVSKKFKAHDEKEIAKPGDVVQIMETRPLSKDKHFRLVKITKEKVVI